MPNGYVHTTATTIASLAMLAYGEPYCALGGLAGLVITPDLDVDGYRRPDGIMRSAYGGTAMRIWRAFWWPYSKAMPHRALRSHFPILGTATRAGYIAAWVVVLYATADAVAALVGVDLQWISHVKSVAEHMYYSREWRAAFCGLAVVDALHAIMDVLVSEVKLWTKKNKSYKKSRRSKRGLTRSSRSSWTRKKHNRRSKRR